VASFENALRGRPDDPALSNRLALALALDGRPDRAEETYRRALALDPGVADLPDNLFRVLRNMGRTDLVAPREVARRSRKLTRKANQKKRGRSPAFC